MKKYNTEKIQSREEYEEIKKENARKLDAIFATPNWLEVYGRKYYPNNWIKHLDPNHPERAKRREENNRNSIKRMKGEPAPYKIRQKDMKVIQLDVKTGKKIKTFNNCKEASEVMNVGENSIIRCARGEYIAAAGYDWKFKEQEKNN